VARRAPGGGVLARRIWHRGREIIALTAALHLAWTVWHLGGQETWNPWPERFLVVLALVDAVIIAVCARSPLFKALFEEFPAADRAGDRPA
jgi:hypothetical protein